MSSKPKRTLADRARRAAKMTYETLGVFPSERATLEAGYYVGYLAGYRAARRKERR